MGALFLASRSTLGTTVLMMPDSGPARVILSTRATPGLDPPPSLWGPGSTGAWELAITLIRNALDRGCITLDGDAFTLVDRLERCTSDVWVMSEHDVLDGLRLTE